MWTDPEGDIWTMDLAGHLMTRLDPRTRKVTGRVPLGDMDPAYPAWGAGSLWVGDASRSRSGALRPHLRDQERPHRATG